MLWPLSVQSTRYSVTSVTALQTNVTGALAIAPSGGETSSGPVMPQPGAGMTKLAFAEKTAGQFSNRVSTNHCPFPLVVVKSCCSLVSFVEPMSENGSLL